MVKVHHARTNHTRFIGVCVCVVTIAIAKSQQRNPNEKGAI